MITHEGWPYQPNLYPADDDLLALAAQECWLGRHVFHMGPGLHHRVSKLALAPHFCNVLSLTNSPDELAAYVQMARNNPTLAGSYQCIFGDINTQKLAWMSQRLDVITLFHLGEVNPLPDYATINHEGVVRNAISHLEKADGLIITYQGSSAYFRTVPIFTRTMIPVLHYRSLTCWKPIYGPYS
jgi:hypothetical protein